MGNSCSVTDSDGLAPADEATAPTAACVRQADPHRLPAVLARLKTSELHRRAIAAGAEEEDLCAALDGGKAVLVELVLKCEEAGQTADADVAAKLQAALDHAVELLHLLCARAPRTIRSRKLCSEVLSRVEETLEVLSADSTKEILLARNLCDPRTKAVFCSQILAAQGLSTATSSAGMPADDVMNSCCSCIGDLLDSIDSATKNSARNALVLLHSSDVGSSHAMQTGHALDILCALPRELLTTCSAEECDAVSAIFPHVGNSAEVTESLGLAASCGLRASACLALHTLSCRNGWVVHSAVMEFILKRNGIQEVIKDMVHCLKWPIESGSSAELAATLHLTINALMVLVNHAMVVPTKLAPGERMAVAESLFGAAGVWEVVMRELGNMSDQQGCAVVSALVSQEFMGSSDLCVACGAAVLTHFVFYVVHHTQGLQEHGLEVGTYDSLHKLHQRVCIDSQVNLYEDKWWAETVNVAHVESFRVNCIWLLCTQFRNMRYSLIASTAWWKSFLDHAMRLVQINASAGLSASARMDLYPFYSALTVLEVAAKDETQHTSLLANVADALEFACVHDYAFGPHSIAASAAGTTVALLGRKEGGKVLSQTTIFACLSDYATFCDGGLKIRKQSTIKKRLQSLQRVAIIAISDANKLIMLRFAGVLDLLVQSLLLGDTRRHEDGADELQCAAARVLQSLALFEAGTQAVKSHTGAMSALRSLSAGNDATEESRKCAEGALFLLQGRKALPSTEPLKADNGNKWIMISYCWDQQSQVKRVHAALVSRSYHVWIDVEQMTGSTVDSMALAVENAEVMLIGVSRQYKESTNCRLEAQYAMQREVPTIPLMLVDGYKADGWLGMLIGTRMWYGFHGQVLTDDSLFEAMVSNLCRDLGDRGKVDHAPIIDGKSNLLATSFESEKAENNSSRTELRQCSLRDLRHRAAREGLSVDDIEDALDSDQPKSTLVELLLRRREMDGQIAGVLAKLKIGSVEAVEMLQTTLRDVEAILDALSTSVGRQERKKILELLDHVEAASQRINKSWFSNVAHAEFELQRLGSSIIEVNNLVASNTTGSSSTLSTVTNLLEVVERCESTLVQSKSILSAPAETTTFEKRTMALKALRMLSCQHLDKASSEEMTVSACVLPFGKDAHSLDIRLLATMALVTLCLRNGVALISVEEFFAGLSQHVIDGLKPIVQSANHSSNGDNPAAVDLAAAVSFTVFVVLEGMGKIPLETREPLESRLSKLLGSFFGATGPKNMPDDPVLKILSSAMQRHSLQNSDPFVACGHVHFLGLGLIYSRPHMYLTVESTGIFDDCLTVFKKLVPSIPSTEWWCSTASVVNVQTVYMSILVGPFYVCSRSLPGGRAITCTWWTPLVQYSIRCLEVNQAGSLCEQPTGSYYAIHLAFSFLVVAAQSSEAVHSTLLQPSLMDAVEYASCHDAVLIGRSNAAEAARLMVLLVGRNEGGKTLNSATVNSLMTALKTNLFFEGYRSVKPLSSCVAILQQVSTMAISDTNKVLMLESDGAIDTLLAGLLLSSPRRTEEGADALQEACAALLLSLALFGPWAEALRTHTGAIQALHGLQNSHLATSASREYAQSTLFELEGRKALPSTEPLKADNGNKWIMISYCWDQQSQVKRVHAALVSRSYHVWIDVEQMTGSTVDSMALAVENAEVMLIGVSRQYKESTNCRLEAQYAMQREVPTIPLMLVDGYKADGWLGMLIGTRMWYGFHGQVLTDDSLFEAMVSNLCRDLGDRGKVDHAPKTKDPRGGCDSDNVAQEPSDLESLSNKELRAHAKSLKVTVEQLEMAADSDDMREALITLITNLEVETSTIAKQQLKELASLSNKQLRTRAKQAGASTDQLEDAADSDDMSVALIELVLDLEKA
eukprot:SAG31_NODE_814_length_11876_cov_16.478984_1_plen_1874_part_00